MPLLASRIRWLSVRLSMLALALLSMLTLSLGAYLLAPVYSWLLYRDLAFWRHLHTFPRVTLQAWRLALRLARDPGYRGMTAFMAPADWIAPPMSGPDKAVVSVSADWPHSEHSCGTCGRCCTEIDCPAFDRVTSLCRCFDSPFWRYFPCGRYPATQAQIDYYGCPKWQLRLPDDAMPQDSMPSTARAGTPIQAGRCRAS